MEILVIIALVILAGLMVFMANRKPEGSSSSILDANKDGKVDLGDAVYLGDIAAKKTKAAATKAKTAVKKTATKAKTAVKKVAAKKPAAKKAVKKTTKK